MSIHRTKAFVTVVLLAAWASLAALSAASARSDLISEQPITVLPNGLIMTPVLINGTGPFQFLVDTGASQSAILASTITDNGLQFRQGRRVLVGGVDGMFETSELVFESVSIGSFQMKDMRLLALPNQSGAGLGGTDGILGTDFWALHIVGFNLDRGALRLYPPKIDFLENGSDTWDVFKMRWRKQDNGLYADVLINGVKARALVDTGASTTGITMDLAAKAGFAKDEGQESLVVGVTGKGLKTRRVIARSITAGTRVWHNVPIIIAERNQFGHNTQVILGMDLLGETPFAIDYGRNRVLMVKPEFYSR